MGLMKKLTSVLVASSLVLGSVGFALADTTGSVQDAYSRLEGYKLVAGVPDENGIPVPALDAPVTRAQLATVIVRAFGHEETAGYLKGTSSFSDVAANAWYSGYVAMIKNLSEKNGIAVGYEDGSFQPEKQISAIETLAFIMKVLGVQPGTGATWAQDTLRIAIDNGLITEADAEAYLSDLNAPASRGLAFAIVDAVFRTATVDGKTLYQVYVDDEAPVLVVDQPAEPTTTKAGDTITGNVKGAEALYLGSEAITVDEEGNFSVEVTFELGENEFVFTAVDAAGNVAEASYKVTRVAGEAAAVVVELGDGTIQAGSEAELVFKLVDANGAEVEYNAEDVKVTIGGEIGSYDKETGIFTASDKAGTGTITVTIGDLSGTAEIKVVPGEFDKVVPDKESAAPGEMVTLTAQDKFGNVIEGATFSQDSPDAMLDSATGKFLASKPGAYTVTAKVGDVEKTAVVHIYSNFSAAAKVVVEAPETIVANGSSVAKVTVKVVDANGAVIKSAKDNIFNLAGPGLTITKKSDSDGVATFEVKAPLAMQGAVVTLTGTANQDGVEAQSGTASIRVLPQVATSLKLTAPKYLAVNKPDGTINNTGASATLTVLDQDGKAMLTGGYGITVTLTGAASFESSSKVTTKTFYYVGNQDGNGVSVPFYPVDLTTTGPITLTASFAGMESATAESTAAYASAEAKVDIVRSSSAETYRANDPTTATGDDEKPTAVTFTAQLRDVNGVPVAKSGVNITFDLDVDLSAKYLEYESGTNTWTQLTQDPVVATDSEGKATLKIRSKNFVGDLQVTAKSGNLTTSTASATFVPGPAHSVAFTRSAVKVAQGTESIQLTAQLYDKAGNKATDSGETIVFLANGTDTWVNGSHRADVTTDETGTATVTVTTLGYVRPGNPYNVTIDLTNSSIHLRHTGNGATDNVTPSVAITIDNSVVANLSVRTQVQEGGNWVDKYYVTQAQQVRILVTAYDSRGAKLDGQTITVTFPKGTILDGAAPNSSEKTITLTPVAGSPGEYEATGIQFVKAPSVSYTVTDSTGVSDLKISASIGVQAGTAAGVKVADTTKVAGNDTLTITKGAVSGPFVLNLVDQYGNPVINTATDANGSPRRIAVSITYPSAGIDASQGQYFEIKAEANGPKVDTLYIPYGASGVTFYVFTNVDNLSVTFSSTDPTGTHQVYFDIP